MRADRAATTYGIAAGQNRRKCRVWNSHDTSSYSKSVWRSE